MKKAFIMALAGIMLFAFTQCGGNGDKNKQDAGNTETTETTEVTKAPESTDAAEVAESTEISGTKQYAETKKMYDELEKMINGAKTCEELQQAAMVLIVGSALSGFSDGKYTAEEKMTKDESEKIKNIADDLLEKAQKKAEQMGCDLGD